MTAGGDDGRVIAIYNVKGGVGKTSAAVNLAYLAAAGGARTLLWDLDPQAASTHLLDPRPKPPTPAPARGWPWRRTPVTADAQLSEHQLLEVFPAELCFGQAGTGAKQFERAAQRLVKLVGPLRGAYDRVLLDCPPSLSPLTEAVFEQADVLLVPVVPSGLSTRALEQVRALMRGRGDRRVLAFLSIVDVGRPLHLRLMRELRELEGVTLLGPAIPNAELVERMGEERRPLGAFAPESPAARAYGALWSEVERHLSASAPGSGFGSDRGRSA